MIGINRSTGFSLMRHKLLTVAILAISTAALQNCARKDNSGTGTADRANQTVDQSPNGRSAVSGPSTEPAPSGSTAGAASGSLDTHERGGGSTGSADRNGRTATKPSRDSVPNVDPHFAGKGQGQGSAENPGSSDAQRNR